MRQSNTFMVFAVAVSFMVVLAHAGNVLAESPHTQIMQELNILQETIDNQVIPNLDECCVSTSVPKTGQITSYETGDDGDLQKGVTWPDPRLTDNVDGTVTDFR